MAEETPAVVIDNGTGRIQAGFAGDDAPRVVFHNLVGTPRNQDPNTAMAGAPLREHYIGEEAVARKGVLTLTQPMHRGVVTDWDSMEHVVREALSGLRVVPPLDRPVLLTEPPLNPAANRELLAQMMFEKFNAPAFGVINQGILALFASGRHAGVIVDCGDGVTYVTPIEGLYERPHAIQRVDTAGSDLTSYLQMLASEKGYNFVGSAGREIARDIKETLCYVATDYDQEMTRAMTSSDVERTYTLPDGNEVTLGNQRFRVPEALFKPSLIGREHDGIHELVYKSIMKCDIDVRSLFYSNIILCGGSTMFSDFGARLQQEVSRLIPPRMQTRVVQPPERKYSVWIGGSILASLSVYQNMWITRAQYEEEGPTIVHRKCS